MIKTNYRKSHFIALAIFAIFLMPVSVFTQTKISYHSNKYSVQDDVSSAVRRQPKLNNSFRSCATAKSRVTFSRGKSPGCGDPK